MALPKLKTPEFKLTLPSTQEEVRYRPFLVREQKILMIAQESEDEIQIADALASLILDCTFGTVDSNINPMFDIEYVFLQIRSKSVGSEVDLTVYCPDDNETTVDIKVELSDIAVQLNIEHSDKVQLTDDIKVNFRYPRLKDVRGMLGNNETEFEKMTRLVNMCIDSVESGEETINRIDMTTDDIDVFVNSFNTMQLESVLKFFETMPKLRHIVQVTNPVTKVKGEVLLEGIESFLE